MSAYSSLVLGDGPRGYWRLGEAGYPVNDSTANGLNFASGSHGGANMGFGHASLIPSDPANGAMVFPVGWLAQGSNLAAVDVRDVFTMEAWVQLLQLVNTAGQTVYTNWYGTNCMRINTANKLELWADYYGPVVCTATVAINDLLPHHVVVTKNGSAVNLYMDGVDVTGTINPYTFTNTPGWMGIGTDASGASGNPANMVMDEVAIYPVALSQAQVLAHYHSGTGFVATVFAPVRPIRLKTSAGWADLIQVGVPAGGAAAAVLTKNTSTDYDAAWKPPAASGSQITYTGAYDPAHTYHDGDYVVGADGITYQCVKEGTVGVTPTPWSPWSVPVPTVVNGEWLKGVGGAAVWSPIAPTDVTGLAARASSAIYVMNPNTDLAWPGGSAYSTAIEVTLGGGTLRSLGVPGFGVGARCIIHNRAGAGNPFTILYNTSGGTGATFITRLNAGLIIANLGESAEFVYDGTSWKEVSADVASIPYGTTLPSTPSDGQEAILVDSITNPSYQWHFRYNAQSTSAYKWEFIGGSQAHQALGNFSNTTGGSTWVYANLLNLPRAGDWDVAFQASVAATNATLGYWQYGIGSVGTGAPGGYHCTLPAGSEQLINFMNRVTMANAGGTLQLGHLMTAQPVAFNIPYVKYQPVRVA